MNSLISRNEGRGIKTPASNRAPRHGISRRGFTFVEFTLAMSFLLGLMHFGGLNLSTLLDEHKGKEASVVLQEVYDAQVAYLEEHPEADISEISALKLRSYMAHGWRGIPVVLSLQDEELVLDYNVMPPQLLLDDELYDPSPAEDDGLWDLGAEGE